MGASMRPEDPADVWDRLVASGKTPDEATAEVTKQFGPPPTPVTRAQLEDVGFIMDRRPEPLGRGVPGIVAESTRSRLGSRPTDVAPLGGLLRSIAAGPTMGTSPYLIGAVRGAVNPNESVGEAIRAEEQALDQFREQYPGQALGAEITAAMVVPLPFGKLGAPKKLAQAAEAAASANAAARAARAGRVATGRVLGRAAAEGAVQGAAETRGGVGARAAGAVIGAGTSAATAGTLGGASRLAGNALGAMPRVNRGLARVGVPVLTPNERASEMLGRALTEQDEVPIAEARRRAIEFVDAGKPVTIADVGGDNTRGVVRSARTRGGTAKESVTQMLAGRAEGAEERVINDLLGASGGVRHDVFASAQQFADNRTEAAQPLFNELRQRYAERRAIPALDQMVNKPSFRTAVREAEALAAESADDAVPPFLITENGQTRVRPLNFEEAQYLKQALDDVGDASKAPVPLDAGGTGNTRKGRQATTRERVVQAMDEAFPGYAEARQVFGSHSGIMRAYDEGRRFPSMTPEAAAEAMRDMSQTEREAFRVAAIEAFITGKVEPIREGLSVERRIGASTRDRKRLRQLFEDEASYEAFRQRLEQEARMHQTASYITGNSQTADKLMELSELFDIDMAGTVAGAATGNPNAFMRLGGLALDKVARGYSENVANRIGQSATVTGRPLVPLLDQLEREMAAIAAKRQAGARTRQTTGRVLGGRLGGAVAGGGSQP